MSSLFLAVVGLKGSELVSRQKKNVAIRVSSLNPVNLPLHGRVAARSGETFHSKEEIEKYRSFRVWCDGLCELLKQVFFVPGPFPLNHHRVTRFYELVLSENPGQSASSHVSGKLRQWISAHPNVR